MTDSQQYQFCLFRTEGINFYFKQDKRGYLPQNWMAHVNRACSQHFKCMVTCNYVYSPLNVLWSDCCWQLRRRDPYGEEGCSSLLLCTLVRTLQGNRRFNLYINFAYKRQNGWTDRVQIFCGTSRDPREGLWMIKFSKICFHQNLIFEKF